MYVCSKLSDKTLTGCLGVVPNVKLVLHVAIFIQLITTHTKFPKHYTNITWVFFAYKNSETIQRHTNVVMNTCSL